MASIQTNERTIAYLLYRELEGTITAEERGELQAWRDENPAQAELVEQVQDDQVMMQWMNRHETENKVTVEKDIWRKIEAEISFNVVPFYQRSIFRVAVAACLIGLLLMGGYLAFFKSDSSQPQVATNDVAAPESNKAVIKLPDGSLIGLDTLSSYTQGSVTVTKTADGKIVYTGVGSEVSFNTLTNPRGSTVIDIALADGSHVWLNAGSSITYPIAFTGNERKVSMTGEAYFEVAHDASKPFRLTKGTTSVTVLGTSFNVNAYDDEPNMKVTLLQGSVRVNSTTIKPGQQAVITDDVKVLSDVNTDKVMAWKNGLFSFDRADIKTVMRQISRWYNVEVEYKGNVTQHFGGTIDRSSNVSTVFNKLEETGGAHFEIEGNKVTVSPQ